MCGSLHQEESGLLCLTLSHNWFSSGPEEIKSSGEKLPWHFRKKGDKWLVVCAA